MSILRAIFHGPRLAIADWLGLSRDPADEGRCCDCKKPCESTRCEHCQEDMAW